jgi:hypothetical protein
MRAGWRQASFLAAFTAGQGYADDAAYSARAWLIHQTHVTSGAAVGHMAWAKRTRTHPRVLAALAAGEISASIGRLICLWTDKLPEHLRDASDELLVAAAKAGLGVEELAAMAAQMYERARSELPDEDPDAEFEDRSLKLATTFGGAGVIHGDLTPECAAVVGQVLDALGAPAGAEDDGAAVVSRRRRCGGWWLPTCCGRAQSRRGCTPAGGPDDAGRPLQGGGPRRSGEVGWVYRVRVEPRPVVAPRCRPSPATPRWPSRHRRRQRITGRPGPACVELARLRRDGEAQP